MKTVVVSANWELFLPDSGHRSTELSLLGRAVRQTREQRGMSPDRLADASGMTRQRIDAIETGRLDPSYDLLLALAEGLRAQPSALVALAEQLKGSSEP
jgi:transcriptional regulator with XRE-family HTH domain